MIVFFGPAGAGKSVQGQILAARYGWRWLSTGQLLRDTHDPEILKEMGTGKLIPDEIANKVVEEALHRSKDINRVIMDGYPRELKQAKWLLSILPKHEREIKLVIVLEVPQSEIEHRLTIRGRADDTPDAIKHRLHIYRDKIYPILNYFNQEKITIAHIDGTGTVGEVHDRVVSELESCSLV
ncbi:MAG TPA: nucleoside monophosphate kinase [Candidatus Saccharimonadales bacterium]|nr:nucleoside monophosphate kinase [Candidatus Saccharimonadales bacterium]